jgi:nicotinate-nucleotide--dimethylbenzimidazole phosphoribosyltransferase
VSERDWGGRFISGVAALVAQRLDPSVADVLFWSHTSAEKAAAHLLAAAGSSVSPVLDMSLRLGEGSGCLLALPVLRAAAAVMSNMATLAECLQL